MNKIEDDVLYKKIMNNYNELKESYFPSFRNIYPKLYNCSKREMKELITCLRENNREYFVDYLVVFYNSTEEKFRFLYKTINTLANYTRNTIVYFSKELFYGNIYFNSETKDLINNESINYVFSTLNNYIEEETGQIVLHATNKKINSQYEKLLSLLVSYGLFTNIINTQTDKFMRLFHEILGNIYNEDFYYKFELNGINLLSANDICNYLDVYFDNLEKVLQKAG